MLFCVTLNTIEYDREAKHCLKPVAAGRVDSVKVKQPQVTRRSTTPTTSPSRRRTSAASDVSRRSLPTASGASGRGAFLWNATATAAAVLATESATAAVSPENATATASSVQEPALQETLAAPHQKGAARSRRAMASTAWAPPTT